MQILSVSNKSSIYSSSPKDFWPSVALKRHFSGLIWTHRLTKFDRIEFSSLCSAVKYAALFVVGPSLVCRWCWGLCKPFRNGFSTRDLFFFFSRGMFRARACADDVGVGVGVGVVVNPNCYPLNNFQLDRTDAELDQRRPEIVLVVIQETPDDRKTCPNGSNFSKTTDFCLFKSNWKRQVFSLLLDD